MHLAWQLFTSLLKMSDTISISVVAASKRSLLRLLLLLPGMG
jgi:hypothetical protein